MRCRVNPILGRRIVIVFVLLLLASIPAMASNARIVRLSYIDGDVQIDRGGANGWETAILNMPVTQSTRLVTNSPESRAEVEFENGSALRLAGESNIQFRELSLNSEGGKVTLITVDYGSVYVDLKTGHADDFRIDFNGDNVSVQKSSRFRVLASSDQVDLAVYSGEVTLESRSNRVAVKKGETLTLRGDDPGRYYLARNIPSGDYDDFNRQRQDYVASVANSNAYSYSNSGYGSAYSYGVSDLAYYGSYNYYPSYGWMWRPYNAGLNWDPFYNGAWSYYPGNGWIFVSTNPWGWAPYRYGSWVWVNGAGWCWRPGHNHIGWQPVPVVIGAPPHFDPPRPPGPRPGPTVTVSGNPVPRPGPPLPRRVVADPSDPIDRVRHRGVPPNGFVNGATKTVTPVAPVVGAGAAAALPGSPVVVPGNAAPALGPITPPPAGNAAPALVPNSQINRLDRDTEDLGLRRWRSGHPVSPMISRPQIASPAPAPTMSAPVAPAGAASAPRVAPAPTQTPTTPRVAPPAPHVNAPSPAPPQAPHVSAPPAARSSEPHMSSPRISSPQVRGADFDRPGKGR